MVSYSPERLHNFPQFNSSQQEKLLRATSSFPLDSFLSNPVLIECLGVDFIYSSAKLEGNAYTRSDTLNLLKLGITAGGKLYSDARMILNLRDAYSEVLAVKERPIDWQLVCDLHATLAKDLLPVDYCGIARQDAVRISGTDYTPPVGQRYLNEELKYLLDVATQLSDPFVRAVYLKLNLCYLQHFQDVNKRTARMVQTSALIAGGVMPLLSGYAKSQGYIEAIVHYYNTGSYEPYLDWFVSSYVDMIEKLSVPPAI